MGKRIRRSAVALINVHGVDRDPRTVRNYGDWVWCGPRAEVDRVVEHLRAHHEITHVLSYGGQLRVHHDDTDLLTPADFRAAEAGVRCRLEDGATARWQMFRPGDAVIFPDGRFMLPMLVPSETAPHAFDVIQMAAEQAERIWSLIDPPDVTPESPAAALGAVATTHATGGNETAGADAAAMPEPDAAQSSDQDSPWITVTNAARIAGVSAGTISRATSSGKLRNNNRTGTARRISRVDLTRWIEARAKKLDRPESDESVERAFKKQRNDD